jgi:lipopolysaccharide/colanic/teichoic acid biosynthesis glycosyltransferase
MSKRVFDVISAALALVVLAPSLVLIALFVKLDSPGPAFFRQERAGKGGRPFRIWKFRTMVDGASASGLGATTGPADPRITRVGRLLRYSSLDEIPQFLNVLLGDMSLVGPRPVPCAQLREYNAFERRVLEVRPGLTSWPGVNGRNLLSWEQRFEMNVWYIDNRTLWLDLAILVKTVWVAFVTHEGVYGVEGVNPEFRH